LSMWMSKAPKGSLLSAVELVTGDMMQISPSPLKSTLPPVSGGYNDARTRSYPVGQPLFVSLAPAGVAAPRAANAAERPMTNVASKRFTVVLLCCEKGLSEEA
jgi:hypothetical protein